MNIINFRLSSLIVFMLIGIVGFNKPFFGIPEHSGFIGVFIAMVLIFITTFLIERSLTYMGVNKKK